MSDLLWRLRARLIRALGVKECGQFGGLYTTISETQGQRWCRKPFGHEDSCAYDFSEEQPGTEFRAKFRGWHR